MTIDFYRKGLNKLCQFSLYAMHIVSAILILFSDNFSDLVLYFELMAMSAVFIIFFSADKAKYGITYAFFHFIAVSVMLVGTSNYHYFSDVDINSLDFYLILISLLITAGIIPFSAWVVYCYSKVSKVSFLILQLFTTKISLVVINKIFPGISNLSSQFLLIAGVLTAIYATICVFTIIGFLRSTRPFSMNNLRNIFSYVTIAFSGVGIALMSYINFRMEYIIIFSVFQALFFYIVASLKEKSMVKSRDQIDDDGFITNILQIILNYIFICCSTLKEVLQVFQDVVQGKFFNKIKFKSLQIDSVEGNILLSLSLMVIFSFLALFYVF